MAAVNLTVSETMGGSAFADALSGGGTGIDMGNAVTGAFTPVSNQTTNAGHKDVFVTHDAVVDPVTDFKTHLGQYGVITGAAYGGATTAAADFTKVLNMGDQSTGAVANNGDGLSSGLHIDMDWQVAQSQQFNPSRIGAQVQIYGDNGGAATGQGRTVGTAYTMHVDAMSRNNAGSEVDASAPVAGKIGKAGDAVLGDQAHPRLRFYVRSNEAQAGIMQWEWISTYAFTS